MANNRQSQRWRLHGRGTNCFTITNIGAFTIQNLILTGGAGTSAVTLTSESYSTISPPTVAKPLVIGFLLERACQNRRVWAGYNIGADGANR